MKSPLELAHIEDSVTGKPFLIAGISSNRTHLTKIFFGDNTPGNWVKNNIPAVEVVDQPDAILNDSEIDLVLIPESQKDNVGLVSTVLTTGKNVRIV